MCQKRCARLPFKTTEGKIGFNLSELTKNNECDPFVAEYVTFGTQTDQILIFGPKKVLTGPLAHVEGFGLRLQQWGPSGPTMEHSAQPKLLKLQLEIFVDIHLKFFAEICLNFFAEIRLKLLWKSV